MEDLKPIVGHGHPMDPNRGKLLSVDDEKRIDEKGRPVVDGKLWGDSATGMYLIVMMHDSVFMTEKPVVGRTEIALGGAFLAGSCKLSIAVHKQGKPTFLHEIVGACLELPDDLANDKQKRQYVIEWMVSTVMECFEVRKIRLPSPQSATMQDLMMAVSVAGQKAIEASGL